MADPQELHDAHLQEFEKVAYIRGMDEYRRLYRRSMESPEDFWAEQARKYLTWEKEWDFVIQSDFEEATVAWFGGGTLNAAYNCLDRHLEKLKNKVAFYWEGDDPGESSITTYADLYEQVIKLAGVLKEQGIGRGDRVVIYLPMMVQLPVAMLACARIGAVHCVVFSGLGSGTLAHRIKDCGAKVAITADLGFRAGNPVPLKENLDRALESCPDVETVIVYERSGKGVELTDPRDVSWQDAIQAPDLEPFLSLESMDAEDPLFILYAGGSVGKSKGLVHTHGGYLLYAAMTTQLVFDAKDHETLWNTADIGWITGHSYNVYGPLINGLTSVLFEGVPSYRGRNRYWEIVEKYKVDKFYTSPSAIRIIAGKGKELESGYDLSSLKLLGCAGEPISPETWKWYHHNVGRDRLPVVDTWLQTETGGHMITPLPGVGPIKPGSCSFPFFGIDPVIVDPDTGDESLYPDQEGILCIRRPWPGMARTVYGDHERFLETYFSRVPGMYFPGDGATKDADGYYWIMGRIDDVVNVSGHRLGTVDVETALMTHVRVAEAAVVGFPHAIKGQGIYAFVIPAGGTDSLDDLKKELTDLVRQEVGPIATIDVVQWAKALPRTRSGKVLRRLLQQIAAGHLDDLGDLSVVSDPSIVKRLVEERLSLQRR
jgi:acetyl-CoA synthetase